MSLGFIHKTLHPALKSLNQRFISYLISTLIYWYFNTALLFPAYISSQDPPNFWKTWSWPLNKLFVNKWCDRKYEFNRSSLHLWNNSHKQNTFWRICFVDFHSLSTFRHLHRNQWMTSFIQGCELMEGTSLILVGATLSKSNLWNGRTKLSVSVSVWEDNTALGLNTAENFSAERGPRYRMCIHGTRYSICWIKLKDSVILRKSVAKVQETWLTWI